MSILLINADSLQIPLVDQSVHCVVTSIPYWGLRDYGVDGQPGLEPTPEKYVANMVAVFREVWRVLRDDGTLWLNIGDSYMSLPSWGRDNGTSSLEGRKHSEVPHALKDQLGRFKRGRQPGIKPKDLVGIPWRVAFALQADGWYLRSDIIWHKPNPMPESVTDRQTKAHEYVFLLTKQPRYFFDQDAVREPVQQVTLDRLNQSNFDNQTGGAKDPQNGGKGSVNRSERRTLENLKERYAKEGVWNDRQSGYELWKEKGVGRNIRTVWTIPTQPTPFAHFATYPERLVEPCIKAGTSERGCCPKCGKPWVRVTDRSGETNRQKADRLGFSDKNPGNQGINCKGGHGDGSNRITTTTGWQPDCQCDAGDPVPCVVLDPFSGSGTTGVVARRLGRHFVGLDLSREYLHNIARQRLELDRLDNWQNGIQAGEDGWRDLPIFQEAANG